MGSRTMPETIAPSTLSQYLVHNANIDWKRQIPTGKIHNWSPGMLGKIIGRSRSIEICDRVAITFEPI